MSEHIAPTPAATLVLFRAGPADGPPELLIVERAKAMRFAAGALVFPGGRVDPGDLTLAASLGGDPEETAARIAAIRETLEETGLAIAIEPLPDSAVTARLRDGLHGGRDFAELLAAEGRTLRLDRLTPFARWLPLGSHLRVFDTRFFLAELPPGAVEPVVDATENTRVFWQTAADVLEDVAAGRAHAIFPTRRNLERLARYRAYDEAIADCARHPWRTISPAKRTIDGVEYLTIPDDLGYPVTSEPMETVRRG